MNTSRIKKKKKERKKGEHRWTVLHIFKPITYIFPCSPASLRWQGLGHVPCPGPPCLQGWLYFQLPWGPSSVSRLGRVPLAVSGWALGHPRCPRPLSGLHSRLLSGHSLPTVPGCGCRPCAGVCDPWCLALPLRGAVGAAHPFGAGSEDIYLG